MKKNAIKIIAHRGYSAKYPENTLTAFVKAQEIGADAVELDVQETHDKKIIVHHDYYLGSPDNGRGIIGKKKLDYINGLVIAPNEHIPTLREVFEALKNTSCQFEIELKTPTENFVKKVIELILEFGLIDSIELTSPHSYLLTTAKNINPNAKTGMFIPSPPDWMDAELYKELILKNAKLGLIDVLHCPLQILDNQFVERAHEDGFLVHVADCNSEIDLNKAMFLDIDQLSTNELALALEVREKRT